jgi:hypothetical protein
LKLVRPGLKAQLCHLASEPQFLYLHGKNSNILRDVRITLNNSFFQLIFIVPGDVWGTEYTAVTKLIEIALAELAL